MNEQGNLEQLFSQASSYVASVSLNISVNDRLFLYSRYKQALEGPCCTSKPSLFDPQGRKKWEAWSSIKDLSKEDAMEQYISKLNKIDSEWMHCDFASQKCGAWVSVSTMMKNDDDDEGREKSVFDFVKENDENSLTQLSKEELNQKDENLMTPLHWACDRGHLSVARFLLESKLGNVNEQDMDGLTALHYASSCGFLDVVKLLVSHGAKTDVKDHEGLVPLECATDTDIKVFMSSL